MLMRISELSRRALYFLALQALLFASLFAKAQSPGGVSSNLTFWLKANPSTPTNIVLNGNNVSQWKSEVGTFSISQATASKQPAYQATALPGADFNFNPSVQFNNATATVLSNTASTPNLLGNTGTIFLIVNINPGPIGTFISYMSNTSYRYQIKPNFRIQNGVTGTGYKFELASIPGAVIKYPKKAAFLLTSVGTGATSKGLRNSTDAGAPTGISSTYNPAISSGLYMGSNNTSEYTNEAVSEVIFFSSVLSAADISKVESYLAVKYGITLNEVPGNTTTNYVASNATVIWNRAGNAPYNNDITFIGRDDASLLMQKQSKSVDSTAIVTMYNGVTAGVFPAMNTDNTTTFSADLSYLGFGDNAQSLNLTRCVVASKYGAMARTWKVQKTGTGISQVTLSVDAAAVSSNVKTLLVSTDPNFATATAYPLSSAAGKLYTDVNFTGNEYFTFATEELLAPQSANIQVCQGATATVNITSPQNGATYNWFTASTGGTSAGTGNSYSIPAVAASTSVWAEAVGPTGCIYSPRTQVDITVNPAAAAPTVNAISICPGNTATLQVQSPVAGTTYSWYNVSTGGTALATGTSLTTTALTSDTTFYVEAGGSGGTCNSTRTAVTVTVTPAPAAPVVNAVSICAGSTASLQVQTPQAGLSYEWFATGSGGTAIATGTSFTTPALNSNTTYYVEAGTSGGCKGPRASVLVTVNPLPVAPTATTAGICPGSAATIFVQNPQAGVTYNWYDVSTGGSSLATGISYTTAPVSSPTSFYVQATGTGGCISIRTQVPVVFLQQLATPVVTVTNATFNSITFSWQAITGAVSYEVSVDGGAYTIPSSGAAGLTHTVSGLAQGQTVNISVRALGSQPCQTSAAGNGTGKTLDGAQEIFVPNVFTPNGDGKNDILKVYGTTIASLELRVFNQYGELIFMTKELNKGWDGIYKGKMQPSGVYVYTVNVVHNNGSKTQKSGAVNLVR